MTAILAWLTGSKIGRYAAAALAFMAALSVVILKAFLAGQAKERAKQTKASLDALRTRVTTDDEISRLPRADRKRAISEWMRD